MHENGPQMRENPDYELTDPERVREVIRASPWATMISSTPQGLVVSHYPFLLEEPPSEGASEGTAQDPDEIVIVSHVGRPDERLHGLGTSEIVVVFYGPSGYVSPSWYEVPVAVPTWNFVTVHAYGTPEILTAQENLAVLDRLVDHFEDAVDHPLRLRGTLANSEYAERIVHGTVGFRMRVTRFVGKEKMSQDKPPEVVERVMKHLEGEGPYANPALAQWMRNL